MAEEDKPEMTDEEAIMKIASAMKDNAPTQDDKHNVHTFLVNVMQENTLPSSSKIGNIRDDKDINELGVPKWNVRGSLEMGRISDKLMGVQMFKEWFESSALETLQTSLSRDGFLLRQATTTTKAVADITKRKKANKGWFKKTEESSGGDPYSSSGDSK